MTRARGANAKLRLKFETEYGVAPSGNYANVPFVSLTLGEQQGLVASDLLGQGRHPQAPALDVVDNDGQAVVPVDVRNFGYWLKLAMGAPASDTQGAAAAGSIAFSAQPATAATITLGATDVEFDDDVDLGATLPDTLTALAEFLNASADADISKCVYALDTDRKTLLVTYKTLGAGGNSFALAASSSPASHATVSASTLAGGGTTGNYNHVFVPGGANPSASLEVGLTDVSEFDMNAGVKVSTLEIALQRSGNLNATIGLIAQSETSHGSTQAGTPTDLEVIRFAQGSGQVLRDGVPIGNLVSGNLKFDNGLDKVEVIRRDGRIAGADEGIMAVTGSLVVRYDPGNPVPPAGTPVDIQFSWVHEAFRLTLDLHEVFLPKPQKPITGPGGVQATYNWQAAENKALSKTLTATLVNDVASY